MRNFLDRLIMLPSTDSFKPHWAAIGINIGATIYLPPPHFNATPKTGFELTAANLFG
jgi:hypothetical protein